uniref:sacsin N-terminal ATP-binding-like domain-containing protein n=1 Tax=Yoonia sp. TaxID=2212373 RepID=UPI0040478728
MDDQSYESGGADPTITFTTREFGPDELEELAISQLEHALDARRRGLKTYESLKNLNDVIGTQYGDRVVFELIQNAHDAHPKDDLGEVAVRLVLEDESRGTLLVANRGRNFSFSNLDSIRNIGTSDKEIGEGIGNKGLGFRSVEALTDDPRIYSQSEGCRGGPFTGYCFRFASNDEIKSRLEKLGAPSDLLTNLAENISRYLVPLPTTEQSDEVLKLAESGFATVVELPLKSAEMVELARKQVAALGSQDAPILLFLERLVALDIEVRGGGEPPSRIRMTRRVANLPAEFAAKPITLHEVELDGRSSFLVVRRVLPKATLLEAVKESIPVAPALKRWLDWKGDAVVSVAVSLKNESVTTSRLFNFLPMDEKAVAPFHGYLDAPFFADIDRRSMHPDLPLNRHLLEAAADACAAAVLLITQNGLNISKSSIVDLITWAQPHVKKLTDAFKRMDQDFTKIKIWPIVSDGGHLWGSLDCLYAWPELSTKYLKPRRLAHVAEAEILLPDLGEKRTVRIRRLAANVGMPMDLTANALCTWVVEIANAMTEAKATRSSQWGDFYEDITFIFKGSSIDLGELRGKAFLKGATGQLLKSAAEGQSDEEKVFVRPGETKGRKTLGPPKPPSSISRKLKFLEESISLSDETFQSFQKAAILRKYDAIEVLKGLSVALGKTPTDNQRTDALTWAFKVWRSTGGGRAVDDALRTAKLFVPTRSGWTAASEALLSSSWTSLGKLLEAYLLDASEHSRDCSIQSNCLLFDYQNWPSASADDKKSDWLRFLDVIGVQDGLHPIAATIRRGGTPNNYWHGLFASGAPALGLGPAWVTGLVGVRLTYPQTDYRLVGECWRIPGQLEHSELPQTARETLSELIVAYLKERGDEHFSFNVQHWKGFETEVIPTPLQIFLREGEWALAFRRDEAVLRRPRDTWSSQTARQVPPRFVERFAAEPGNRGAVPQVLFDNRVGLRDWTSPDAAGQRLIALADALVDLSATERRDLRDQLRRAWSDVSSTELDLPLDLPLVVERNNGLDVCRPTAEDPPVVYLTSERQGFAARALVDQGAAVLDLGASDPGKVSALLSKANGFDLRSVDTVDVRMIVDGNAFEPSRSFPLIVAGALGWIADAAVLAHEFLGDPLELRTLPPETLEQRIRQIRVGYCKDFSLVIGDHVVSASGREQVQPFLHSQLPTLIVARVEVDLSLLISAAPALTKLVGARRNTLETMLTRLERSGFTGRDGGPTEEQYARAIQREVAIVRDHFAATKGGVERRVRFLLPAICCLAGDVAVDRLSEAHSKLGSSLQLRSNLLWAFRPRRRKSHLTSKPYRTDPVRITLYRLRVDSPAGLARVKTRHRSGSKTKGT